MSWSYLVQVGKRMEDFLKFSSHLSVFELVGETLDESNKVTTSSLVLLIHSDSGKVVANIL